MFSRGGEGKRWKEGKKSDFQELYLCQQLTTPQATPGSGLCDIGARRTYRYFTSGSRGACERLKNIPRNVVQAIINTVVRYRKKRSVIARPADRYEEPLWDAPPPGTGLPVPSRRLPAPPQIRAA